MEQIIIDFAPDGTAQISVDGVAGPSCKDLTRPYETALGSVAESNVTADYWSKDNSALTEKATVIA